MVTEFGSGGYESKELKNLQVRAVCKEIEYVLQGSEIMRWNSDNASTTDSYNYFEI